MKQNILVFDRSAYIKETLAGELSGYNLIACKTGESAVDKLVKNDVIVALVDIRGGSGEDLKAIDIIREVKPRLQVIVISDDENIELEREARKLGVTSYLTKPVSGEMVRELVDSAVKATVRR